MEIVVLNQGNKLSTFLVVGTTFVGVLVGLIFTRVNFQSPREIKQVNGPVQDKPLYSHPFFYNSSLGAILGCTFGLIKVNIRECKDDFDQENYRIDS